MEIPELTVPPGRRLHHVGIAVDSIEGARPTFELLTGVSGSPVEEVASQRVRVCFVGIVELLEPTDPTSTVARFLERRGPGLHHLAFAVDDLAAELAALGEQGVRLIDSRPRAGAFGHQVAFLHPESSGRVLIELVQTGD
ncbi:MAG: methylmalonyl-CoA epimerase [Gemmatimonadota bacterium]